MNDVKIITLSPRDKVLKNIGNVDAVAKEKSDEVRKRYEKKLQTIQKELSKLQNAKREHTRLQKTKVSFFCWCCFVFFYIVFNIRESKNLRMSDFALYFLFNFGGLATIWNFLRDIK